MSHPYRVRGDDQELRVARLEAEVAALEARLAEAYWNYRGADASAERERFGLDAGSRSLACAAPGGAAAGAALDELEQRLTSYREELEDAIRRAPAVEAELTALPQTIGQGALGDPWPAGEVVVLRAREFKRRPASRAGSLAVSIAAYVSGHDERAEILERAKSVRVPSFRAFESPMALEAIDLPLTDVVMFSAATPVARALAPMRLAPQSWVHAVTTAVRLQTDATTGDLAFDRAFMVDGPQDLAESVLTAAVRADLSKLARDAPPELTVGQGFAKIRWHYPFARDVLDRALRILSALRHAPIPLALVRPVQEPGGVNRTRS